MAQHQAMFEAPAHEAHYSNSYSNPYSNPEFEDEWETHEAHYSNSYSSPYSNPEADPFFPLIAKLGAKLLPKVGKLVFRGVKRLIPRAKQMASKVVRQVQQSAGGQASGGAAPTQIQTARALVEQLRSVLSEGESEAATLEAEFFGANEFEGELANHQAAHEIALTEVLAAEASHTESESEAEALLNTALPITIRVMGGSSMLRQATPALVRANASLVRSLHRQGRDGRHLLRIVSAIHRRTIASLRALRRSGRPITPRLVSRVMAGHAAQVLGNPQILGTALVRNFAIRRGTVAPAKQLLQRHRAAGF